MDRTILISVANLSHGGLETRIAGELRYLRSRGYKIILATASQEAAVHELGLAYDHAVFEVPFDKALTPDRLREMVQLLSEIIQERGVTEVWAHPFPSILPAVLAAEKQGIPRRVFLHGPLSLAEQGYGALWTLVLRQFILPAAEEIVAVSEEVREVVEAAALAPLQRVSVVMNGVNTGVFQQKPTGLPPRKRVLVVSRLDRPRVKAIMPLLKAAAAHEGWGVDIAGDGTARARLERAARMYGLTPDRVTFLGARHDIAELHGDYDIVAANGRAFLEAASGNKLCVHLGPEALPFLVSKADFETLRTRNYSGRGVGERTDDVIALLERITDSEAETYRLRDVVVAGADERRILETWGVPDLSFVSSPISGLLTLLDEDVVPADVSISNHPGFLSRMRRLAWPTPGKLAFQDLYIDFLEVSRSNLNDRTWRAEQKLRQLQREA
ncbi:glycosyltransferase [Hyphomonas pacifica]|uniref:Glycosyltransferase subfamily 4-like N-terminal domain-containing protein n=1 Tax=Hyphomonas pacifica TaxID=1280941 RepID=A0A062TQB6_9PROT|nr:glycosyltransferase [Hyphomonas pacifica]KCZ49344.1 hypothetical protein HY2_02885 [Hyphomonas pacifica]RAN33150.1 hypothetical protein HY3_02050 [Hyphomonas pacifica]